MAVVDKVAGKHGTKAVAQAYLEYLYTTAGQEIAAQHFYRPRLAVGRGEIRGPVPQGDAVHGGRGVRRLEEGARRPLRRRRRCSTRSTSRGASPAACLPLRRDDDAAQVAERAPRIRAVPGDHLHLPQPDGAAAAGHRVHPDGGAIWVGVLGHRHRSARAGLLPSHLRRLLRGGRWSTAVFGLLVAWVLVRYRFPGRRIVDAMVDLPFALADRGGGHRAHHALRAERLDRSIPRAARHQGLLHLARHHRRADLHRPAVRGPHGAAGAGRSGGRGRGGRGQPRRQALADLHAGRLSHRRAGAAHRLRAGVRPGHWASTARWSSSRATCR